MRRRLFALLIVPLVVLAAIGSQLALRVSEDRAGAEAAARAARIATQVAAVDAAIGNETLVGTSSVFRAQKGDAKLLEIAQGRTDRELMSLEEIMTNDRFEERLDRPILDAIDAIGIGLQGRNDLANGWISPLQLVDRNRTLRDLLVESMVWRVSAGSYGSHSNQLLGFVSLIEARSAHLDERVSIDLVVRYRAWAPGQHSIAIVAIAEQTAGIARAATLIGVHLPRESTALADVRHTVMTTQSVLDDRTPSAWGLISDGWLRQLEFSVTSAAKNISTAVDADRDRAVNAQRTTVAGIVLAMSVAVVAATLFGVRLVRRVRSVADAAASLALEDSPIALLNDSGTDEIAEMAQAFDRMAERIGASAQRQAVESRILGAIASDGSLENIVHDCNLLLPLGHRFVLQGDVIFMIGHDGVREALSDAVEGHISEESQLAFSLAQLAQWRAESLRALRQRAAVDVLTSLRNRASLLRALDEECRDGEPAVLYLDLDNFKRLNDNHGHEHGDRVLQGVGRELQLVTDRIGGVAGRVGGDEFVLVLPVGPDFDLRALGNEIVDRVDDVAQRTGDGISASVGISRSTGQSAAELLHEADAAMYRAKASGKGRVVVADIAMRAELASLQNTERGLGVALADNEFTVAFQEIWDPTGRHIVALEALARWTDAAGVAHPPSAIFRVAERIGRAPEVDRLILANVCRQIQDWERRGIEIPPVHVNMSAQSLNQATFVTRVLDIVSQHECAPRSIVVELTESALVHDIDSASARLGRLRLEGIKIAVDDLGEGYASLNYLSRLPIDILKIDRQFIDRIDLQRNNRAIVGAITELAGALGMTVVAEGVERIEEHHELQQVGGVQLQGYFFSRPSSAADIERRLAATRSTPQRQSQPEPEKVPS